MRIKLKFFPSIFGFQILYSMDFIEDDFLNFLEIKIYKMVDCTLKT